MNHRCAVQALQQMAAVMAYPYAAKSSSPEAPRSATTSAASQEQGRSE